MDYILLTTLLAIAGAGAYALRRVWEEVQDVRTMIADLQPPPVPSQVSRLSEYERRSGRSPFNDGD